MPSSFRTSAALALVVTACRDRPAPPSSSPVAASAPLVGPSASSPAPSAVASSPPPRALPALPVVTTDWCIAGLGALDEETCAIVPPPDATRPRRLLVYLHGITPDTKESPQKTAVQTAVLRAAMRAGAAAIVPRGRRGIGPGDAKDWWAWPTSPDTHAKHAAAILARIAAAKEKLEALLGARFDRTYLAGSSNGAYFITALALRGDLERLGLPVDGIGVMSGGASGGASAASLAALHGPKTYVGYGTYDEETKKNAAALVALLAAARWPHRAAEHPFGHGAREVYIDEAFAFWDKE